jgi:hypothetical protein
VRVTDPFQFYKGPGSDFDPGYRASDDAVESWVELAGQVRDELGRMGFPATVLTDETRYPYPAGAHVVVYAVEPFGVALDWNAPIRETDYFKEKIIARDTTDRLFRYVVSAKELTVKAMHDILHEAGFRTLMDHQEGNLYTYRILGAPDFPLR